MSYPEASASALPSPVLSSTGPPSSSPTNPLVTSTPRQAKRSWRYSTNCMPGATPSSSSPTSPTLPTTPTASLPSETVSSPATSHPPATPTPTSPDREVSFLSPASAP